jgi:hypothetical protein
VIACVRNVVSIVGPFIENFDSIQLTHLMFHHRGITGNAPSMKPRYYLGLHYVRLGVYRPAYCGIARDQKTTTNFFRMLSGSVFSATSKNYTHLLILIHKLTARD